MFLTFSATVHGGSHPSSSLGLIPTLAAGSILNYLVTVRSCQGQYESDFQNPSARWFISERVNAAVHCFVQGLGQAHV